MKAVRARSVVRMFASLLMVLATLFGAGTASAATTGGEQTRVGASVVTVAHFVAPHDSMAAGQRLENGLPRVGRALQKHSDRAGSVFGGLSSGNPIARNEQGMRVLDEILEDPGSTTQVLENVTNIWDSTGRGIRLSNDGTFMGLLEPLP